MPGGWGIKKFNLDDLYIRFFRLAERRIVEGRPGKGIVCFISNFSYLSDPSFVVMRHRFIREFDALWFDCMNGDSRETGKLTPDGKPDPSVFSTEYHQIGIRVGTAISLLVRRDKRPRKPPVRYRDFWGVTKRVDLLASLNNKKFNDQYESANPTKENRFSFRPSKVDKSYSVWPKIIEFSAVYPFNGPIERRGNSLIVHESDKTELDLLRQYLDPTRNDEQILALSPRLIFSSGEFDAKRTRQKLKGNVNYDPNKIFRYPFKPFDIRLAYLDPALQPLFSRPSPELLAQRVIQENRFIISRDTADKSPEGPPFFFSRMVCDYDCISGHARHFPVYVTSEKAGSDRLQGKLDFNDQLSTPTVTANLSNASRQYLAKLGIKKPDVNKKAPLLLWLHVLAIGYSSAYIKENADGIKQDWPRIPLPNSRSLLEASANLGRQVSELLDTEMSVNGVTSGNIRIELKFLGIIRRTGDGALNPATGELDLTAGWGHPSKARITMPGQGKTIERAYNSGELSALEQGATIIGLTFDQALKQLGKNTCDIYLNAVAFWQNVPANVWDYTIGGYQVIKKWLSYRERDILGRGLTPDEVREVTNMVRRIAAILLLGPGLDENYRKVKQSCYAWPKK